MRYVWAVVDSHGNPLLHTVADDEEMAIRLFMHARPETNGVVLAWEDWQARGYRCERYTLDEANGLER